MPTVTLNNVSPEMLESLKLRAEAEQIGVGRAALRLLESALTGAPPPPVVPVATGSEMTLEAAANVMLQYVRPEQANLIVDLAAETGRQRSDYLLGYIRLADERGDSAVRIVETVGGPVIPQAAPPQALVETVGTCEECRAPFVPSHRGQRFCPDPDDGTPSCGRQYSLRTQIHPSRHRGLAPGLREVGTPMPPLPARAQVQAQASGGNLEAQMAAMQQQLAALMAMLPQPADREG